MNLTYTIQGKGPAIVFIHGFCEHPSLWNSYIENLSQKYSCLNVSLPGHNRVEAISEFSILNLAEELIAIIEENNFKEVILIGHSMGGYIASALLNLKPELVKGVCFFHSSMQADSDEKKINRNKSIEFIEKHGSKHFLNELINKLYSSKFAEEQPSLISDSKRHAQKLTIQTLKYCLQAMRDREKYENIKSFASPVFYIIGKEDQILPYQQLLMEAIEFPQSNILIAEHSGHLAMKEEVELCKNYLQFIVKTCYD